MDWVLLVDDEEEIRGRMAAVLEKEGMKVTQLTNGEELLAYIEGMVPLPDLVLLDVVMGGMNGLETLKKLRETLTESELPVIFLTGSIDMETEAESFINGAVDFIRKPVAPAILTLRVRRTIEFMRLQRDLTREVARKTKENNRLTLHVVQTLAEAIDAKDTYTNGHSGRVAAYSRQIAAYLGYDERAQDEVYMMGLLHDVGKIGVPDWIINKTDRLTDEEFREIKKHPEVGERILRKIREMPRLSFGARWHHERYGGGGYPDGIRGAEIPEEARIIAVADAYDAMTSNRSYRRAMPQSQVRAEIEKGKGTQFDPRIADVMVRMIDEDTEYLMREGAAEEAGLPERSSEETSAHLDAQVLLPEALAGVEALDTEMGIYLCGDPEDYLEALEIFAKSVPSKSERIENALRTGDTETATILLHSLKSSARTIGAADLSTLAADLESAGKRGDLQELERGVPELLSAYRDLGDTLTEGGTQL